MAKPDWKAGDWVYRDNGTSELLPGQGCTPHVHRAESDPQPTTPMGERRYDWHLGYNNACWFRKVTVNDVYRLLTIASGELQSVTRRISNLQECLKQITGDKFSPTESDPCTTTKD